MSDDWDIDDEPVNSGSSTPAPAVLPPKVARGKWQGEDEEEEQDDWDASEDEKPKAATTSAPAPKKKMTLKQKLAEKERLAAEARESGSDADGLMETMTEQERRRLAREREQEADMAVAADLMGGADLDESPVQLLQSILKSRPTTKNDFTLLSKNIFNAVIKQHENNPLYSHLVEQLAKDMSEALTAVQTRKVSSSLSVLGNTKQQEERDKASGKKKTAAKPKLGAVKAVSSRIDTEAYDDVLDDDDFM
ncbi:hypothetical protein IAU60_004521 [Kwoniella sp. DSM 27419]